MESNCGEFCTKYSEFRGELLQQMPQKAAIFFHRNHSISYKRTPHSQHFLQKRTQKPCPGKLLVL